MRKFKRVAVAAAGLLAFAGVASLSAQSAQPAQAAGGYADGKYGSFSSCQSSAKGNQVIEKFHCVDNGDGSWTLWVDQDHCAAAASNSAADQASTKNEFSLMGC